MDEVLIISGHDYSRYVERRGFGWTRNDIDSDTTTRTKDGRMRRQKLTQKRKCSYTLVGMTREELAQLDTDLSAATFSATYLDLHGVQTREFYTSSFSVTGVEVSEHGSTWEGATFNMTEV